MDPIGAFVELCDVAAERRGWTRSTLSTYLFRDGKRLDQLASGNSDVGVLRLEAAKRRLSDLIGGSSEAAA